MNTNEIIKRLYNEQDYHTWAESTGLSVAEATVFDRHLAGTARDARILDVGTGGGRLAFELQTRGFSRITGIDLSERMIDAARERAQRERADVRFEVQDAADLHFPDGSFEVVLALQQLLSILDTPERRAQALREMHRVLAPGGLLVLSVLSWEGRPINPWISAAIAPFKWLKGEGRFGRHCLPIFRMGGKPNVRYLIESQAYVYYFTKERFERALGEARFDLLALDSSRMLEASADDFSHGGYLHALARRMSFLAGFSEFAALL